MISRQIEVKTINYLLKKDVPSLLVLYNSENRQAYYTWIEDYIKNVVRLKKPNWKSQQKITIKIPQKDAFNRINIDYIKRYLFFKKLKGKIEPLKLIRHLSTALPTEDFGYLKERYIKTIIGFLETTDVKELIKSGELTWDDVYLITNLSVIRESIKNAGVVFSERMASAFIEITNLEEASHIIDVIGFWDKNIAKKTSYLWWKQWMKQKDLDLVIPMVEWIPEDKQYALQVASSLQNLFPIDTDDEEFGAFGEWLREHSKDHWDSAKKLVDLLGFIGETRADLYRLIDEEEQ